MSPWRTVFFGVNFGAAVLFVVMCVISVAEGYYGGGSPFAFLGGMCFVWPALAFAVGEWLLYRRNIRSLERHLGIACQIVGTLAVFAFITTVVEAGADVNGGPSPGVWFWVGFGAVCLAVGAYGLWCGGMRVNGRTFPQGPGFPVIDPASRSRRGRRADRD